MRPHDPQRPVPPALAAARAHAPAARAAQMRLPWAAWSPAGDHRAACATSGVLSTRVLPLEHAVARVCREAGTQVARNVRLDDMIDVPVADARRIEVVANGLPLWHGPLMPQLFPPLRGRALTRQGQAHPALMCSPAAQAMRLPGASATTPTRSSAMPGDAAWLSLARKLVAGSAPKLCNSCASSRGTVPPPSPGCYVLPPSLPG